MKLNNIPNFRIEDFLGEKEWIGKLFTQLNPFMTTLSQIINLNIDYESNIQAVTRSYSIATIFQRISIQWPFKNTVPSHLIVTKASKSSLKIPAILLASWAYDPVAQSIIIFDMIEASSQGVSALSGQYDFTVRVTI